MADQIHLQIVTPSAIVADEAVRYVRLPLEETIWGFEVILGGECDDIPEQAFLMCGTIDEVLAKRYAL